MLRDLSFGLLCLTVLCGGRSADAQAIQQRPVPAQRQAGQQPVPRQQQAPLRTVGQPPQGQRQVQAAGRRLPQTSPQQQSPAGQRQAANRGGTASRQLRGAHAPNWIPLTPEHEKRLDDILKYWEHSTKEIERYRCVFKRWEYEPTLKTYSEGVIKFATPDKGLFRVEKVQHRRKSGQTAEAWVEQKEGYREHWVCDGKSIWEFDHQQRRLVERTLPPDVRGQRIIEGPLPFMFGAKAEQIRQRFWIRPIWPEGSQNEYWLELVPKTREDAVDFRKLKIVIAEQDYLPKGMILYHRNNSQTTFVFDARETNWNVVAQQLNIFYREFYEPKTPRGWEKIVEPGSRVAPNAPPNRTRQAKQRAPQTRPRR